MKKTFISEREELLRVIRSECEDIITQAQVMLKERKNFGDGIPFPKADGLVGTRANNGHSSLRSSHLSAFHRDISVGASADTSSSRQSAVIHPEMLSPEETQKLVRSVLERVSVSTFNDFRKAYGGSRVSIDDSTAGHHLPFDDRRK